MIGEFDSIDDAGINPLPRHPIPIWIGGTADVVLRRAAQLSAGYVAQAGDPALAKPLCEDILRLRRSGGQVWASRLAYAPGHRERAGNPMGSVCRRLAGYWRD